MVATRSSPATTLPRAVLDFARAENATQLVVGASPRTWLQRVLGGLGTAAAIVAHSGSIDVHIVTHDLRLAWSAAEVAQGPFAAT